MKCKWSGALPSRPGLTNRNGVVGPGTSMETNGSEWKNDQAPPPECKYVPMWASACELTASHSSALPAAIKCLTDAICLSVRPHLDLAHATAVPPSFTARIPITGQLTCRKEASVSYAHEAIPRGKHLFSGQFTFSNNPRGVSLREICPAGGSTNFLPMASEDLAITRTWLAAATQLLVL